jgi:hypothetical protein
VKVWSRNFSESLLPLKGLSYVLERAIYSQKRTVNGKDLTPYLHLQWQPAESGRLECRKDFPSEKEWNKRYYKIKQVRPIFMEEAKEIIVITVYTYFY